MRICFADPLPDGHRAQHVVAIAREIARRSGIKVLFAVHPNIAELAQSSLYGDSNSYENCVFRPLTEGVFRQVRANNRDIFGGFRVLRKLEQIAKANGCHHIHFMHLDTFLPGLALRVMCPWGIFTYSGLYFRPTMHYEKVFNSPLNRKEARLNKVKAVLLSIVLASARVKLIQSLDNYFPLVFENHRSKPKLAAIPDLSSPPEDSKKPEDLLLCWTKRPVRLLLFGAISSRKGVFVLLGALKKIPRQIAGDLSVLLAGSIKDSERQFLISEIGDLKLKNPHITVNTIDRYLSDEELWWLIGESSLVLMPYQRHLGSSGILCWAAAANKPVLSQSFGLIGHEVRQNNLGIAVDTEDPNAIARAIAEFRQVGGCLGSRTHKRQAYASLHTEHAFGKAVLESIISSIAY